ncbi:MAG: hypothetical protein COA63_010920 [Methylophaga sp.]|nr:hypothetical protein [Methylophaga sp.]
MSKLLIVLVMFNITGCSNKALYDKFILDNRDDCATEPTATYFECIERANITYEEYERERKKITESQDHMTDRKQ